MRLSAINSAASVSEFKCVVMESARIVITEQCRNSDFNIIKGQVSLSYIRSLETIVLVFVFLAEKQNVIGTDI